MTPATNSKQSEAVATTSATDSEVEELAQNQTTVGVVTPLNTDSEDNNNECSSGNDNSDGDDDEEEEEIPTEFICPLTFEIFVDPLMTRAGHNFERQAILSWLRTGHDTCPLTRTPLSYNQLIPNSNLRTRVEKWKRDHGHEVNDDVENERREDTQFLFLIDCPPDSDLELRLNRNLEAVRLLGRRQSETRSPRPPTGVSPATQRRRLSGLLNVVRRNPLTGN